VTRRQFEKRVRWWTRQLRELGLEHWDLHFEYPQADEDVQSTSGRDAQATCSVSMHYDTAYIEVAPSTLGLPQHDIDKIIVHELLHVLMRDLTKVHNEMRYLIGGQVGQALDTSLEHEVEGVVERLARAIVLFNVTLQELS
jgi:ribosomal protein S9